MRQWQDSAGRQWTLDLTVGAMLRVKAAGCDIPDRIRPDRPDERDLVLDLLFDPLLVGHVLWAMLAPDAEKRAVTQEQFFADGLRPPAWEIAADLLLEEIADFFRQRGALVREKKARALQVIAELSTAQPSGESSGGSRESSASTPDR